MLVLLTQHSADIENAASAFDWGSRLINEALNEHDSQPNVMIIVVVCLLPRVTLLAGS